MCSQPPTNNDTILTSVCILFCCSGALFSVMRPVLRLRVRLRRLCKHTCECSWCCGCFGFALLIAGQLIGGGSVVLYSVEGAQLERANGVYVASAYHDGVRAYRKATPEGSSGVMFRWRAPSIHSHSAYSWCVL